MSEILVKRGEHKELMKIFKCSHVTVRESLRGNVATKLGVKIRKAAIERGGVELQPTSIKS
jgi:DNA-binding CsgD family transcriptional regulator